MADPPTLPPSDPNTTAPHWHVRSGGWDTHAHVFGPHARFPLPAARPYSPPEEPVAAYMKMLDALGVRHGVLVQPSVYGSDHTCMFDALQAHPDRLIGVVDLDLLSQSDAEIARMSALGVRGLRLRWPDAGGPARLRAIAVRMGEIGWRLDLLPQNLAALADIAPHLQNFDAPIMVEAMGHPDPDEGPEAPGFQALLALARDRRVFVKLSHPYHIDPTGLPYPRAAILAEALVAAAPTQLVWGSDWPHPMREAQVPNDGDLLDFLPQWAGGTDLANTILVDNPARFFGVIKELVS